MKAGDKVVCVDTSKTKAGTEIDLVMLRVYKVAFTTNSFGEGMLELVGFEGKWFRKSRFILLDSPVGLQTED